MRKLVDFVMVGLAFIGLQVAVAGAQTSMPPMGDHSGMPPMGDHSGMMAPPTGAPAKQEKALVVRWAIMDAIRKIAENM